MRAIPATHLRGSEYRLCMGMVFASPHDVHKDRETFRDAEAGESEHAVGHEVTTCSSVVNQGVRGTVRT